ncbi:transporter substrate-binding domain-containing protein [Streptomyces sp. NPDC101178]|uniref:transporter substrate-binding domain-containing protein n=1 Tax=Streptomyces sp. NPDC101178 TaxID=3366124 RepID=UPI003828E051
MSESSRRPRQHNPEESPTKAMAWALVRLRDEHELSLGQMAKSAGYTRSTLSRVTEGESLPKLPQLQAYLKGCGVSSPPWETLLKHAQEAVRHENRDIKSLQDFAVALKSRCEADLPKQSSDKLLPDASVLATTWHRVASSTLESAATTPLPALPALPAPTEPEEPEPSRQERPKPHPPTVRPAGTDDSMRSEQPSSPRSAAGPLPPAAKPPPTPKPPRTSGRHMGLIGSATVLALLASGTVWAIAQNNGTPSHGRAPSDRQTTATTPTSPAEPSPDDPSMERLNAARKGKVKWNVGVKRDQPGLSGKVGNKWTGVEIEYAKAVTEALGIDPENIAFFPRGTSGRAELLENNEVDMFVGTYGISEERKKGTADHPAVLFAGPYFSTPEKIMMQASEGPNNAQIRGRSIQVNALEDLPDDTRVCVVQGSTADIFLTQQKKFEKRDKQSDYSLCVNNLDENYDAVLTDFTILQNFVQENPGKFVIASDPFGSPEYYGIGLKQTSFALQREVCKAMEKTADRAKELYGKFAQQEAKVISDLTECPAA